MRMFASLNLADCLLFKAVYMIMMNVRARCRTKTHCLTFGDVIVASVLYPDLQIHNECLVNAGDDYRHRVIHTCHLKHCKESAKPSPTSEVVGHCQKCTKLNIVDRAADLVHPCVAIK